MPDVELDLDSKVIKRLLNEQSYTELIVYLNDKFRIILDDTGQPIPIIIEKVNLELLSTILNDTDNPDVIAEVFKSLRNCGVNNSPATQQLLLENDVILNCGINILVGVQDSAKIVLQFLTNCVINNAPSAIKVWHLFQPHILSLIQNEKYAYFSAALFYNILYLNRNLDFSVDLYDIVLELCSRNFEVNDYYLFLLDLFKQNGRFFVSFSGIKVAGRVAALQYMLEHKDDLDPAYIKYLSVQFKKTSDCILKTVTSYVDQIEPEEVVLLLELLASLSTHEKHISHIQNDKSLLINCVYLLQSIHASGKNSDNHFSPIEKVWDADGANTHPIYGFKGHLIKLIGNMCWRNAENQNQLRELEGIPILLECCSIDARNPFITQWCILAIRNLCEDNLENRAFIAGMRNQGVVDSTALHNLGLTLHDDGSNKIGIVPLDIVKSVKN